MVEIKLLILLAILPMLVISAFAQEYQVIIERPELGDQNYDIFADLNQSTNYLNLRSFILPLNNSLETLQLISEEIQEPHSITYNELSEIQDNNRFNPDGTETDEYIQAWVTFRAYNDIDQIIDQIIELHNQGMSMESAFNFLSGVVIEPEPTPEDETEPEPQQISVDIRGKQYYLSYTAENVSINEVIADLDFISLVFDLEVMRDGVLTINFERDFFGSTFEGKDDDFIVLANGDEVHHIETSNLKTRILQIDLPSGTEELEIIGSYFIDNTPEEEFPLVLIEKQIQKLEKKVDNWNKQVDKLDSSINKKMTQLDEAIEKDNTKRIDKLAEKIGNLMALKIVYENLISTLIEQILFYQ